MDGVRKYYTKQNKSEKDKYHMISLICEFKKQSYREQTDGYWMGGGLGEWVKWVMGIGECTCSDGCRVLYVSVESLNFTSEITLHYMLTGI